VIALALFVLALVLALPAPAFADIVSLAISF